MGYATNLNWCRISSINRMTWTSTLKTGSVPQLKCAGRPIAKVSSTVGISVLVCMFKHGPLRLSTTETHPRLAWTFFQNWLEDLWRVFHVSYGYSQQGFRKIFQQQKRPKTWRCFSPNCGKSMDWKKQRAPGEWGKAYQTKKQQEC